MAAPNTQSIIDALRALLGEVERLPVSEPVTLAQQAASGALERLESQLRALIALATTAGVGPAEIDVTGRGVLEAAITMTWISTDEARATRFHNHGIAEGEKYANEMARNIGFDCRESPVFKEFLSAKVPGANSTLPNLGQQANECDTAAGGSFFREGYHVSYRRLSAAMHGDSRTLLLQMQPHDGWKQMALFEAAISAATLLTSVSKTLQLERGKLAAGVLFDTLAPGHPRPL